MAELLTMSTAEMVSNAAEMTKVLHDLQGTIYFVIKQLRPSHVPENGKKNCTLVGYSRQRMAPPHCFMPNSVSIVP